MIRAVVICFFLVLSAGCASHDEVARSSSPDRTLDAVVIEGNGGATTSFWYDIYITKAGAPYASGLFVGSVYGAVRNESAWGVNLKWKSPVDLDVEYLSAKKATLEHPHITLGNRSVNVTLLSGVVDATAKPGGMLYNREGRGG